MSLKWIVDMARVSAHPSVIAFVLLAAMTLAVSYTHLDVYKRQPG